MIHVGIDNHAATATLSGGSWSSDWPLTKLQSADLSAVARSSDATNASTVIQWDNGAAKNHDAVVLAAHNLSTSATIKLSLGTSAGGSQVYAGTDVAAYSVDDSDRNGISHIAVIMLPTTQSARYGKLEIKDSGNADGYVEVGYLWAGSGLRPTYNAAYGLQDRIIDHSESERTYGGRFLGNARRRYRQVSLVLEWVTLDEAEVIHRMQRVNGKVNPVLYLPSMESRENAQRYGFVGVMSELSPIQYPFYRMRSAPMLIEEL